MSEQKPVPVPACGGSWIELEDGTLVPDPSETIEQSPPQPAPDDIVPMPADEPKPENAP